MEVVYVENGDRLPAKRSSTRESIVIGEGRISLERDDCAEPELHIAKESVEIPAGVTRRITAHEPPTRLVLIHPRTSA